MIKKSLTLLFILFCFCGFSQKIIQKNLESTFLNTTRSINIYIPEGYVKDSIKNYPLTVVLDEDYMFDLYVGNAVLFSKKDKAPKQIVVGVSMKDSKGEDISYNINNGQLTSSAQNFYTFIRDEVIFYMESTYRTSPFITLVGQGYSANLITHFLQEDTAFINSFICINPSFSDFIGGELQSYNLSKFGREDNTFYFYTNNSTSFSTDKQTQIDQVQKGLAGLGLKNFNIINDIIDTPSSISAMSEAIPRALTKVFEVYSGITKEEYDKNIKDLAPLDAISYLENKYLEIEFLFGSSLGIRENDIYAIENIIIEKENGDRLRDFGKMILKIFPSSPLGDYYIGRYYESGKMIKKAITQYKIGYGKMDPADPNADAFYENILRLGGQ
ncbi:alpha/beta hydrolase-fold protein [uncultured Polaribacter sp.]|uniref:alpha/beta hydrolase-fold protein n=1 Tax=uncultured Polaribacter sp. TaxID=174711 RepID=UPI0030DDBA41|tara:strand:- start:23335 stop:24492 length:1158 start_codon:yes stop_codon:yes gene_type:complete